MNKMYHSWHQLQANLSLANDILTVHFSITIFVLHLCGTAPHKWRKPHIKNTSIHPSIRPSVNQYQKLNHFSDFNALQYRNYKNLSSSTGHAVAQLRHCATSRKAPGSIPDYVIWIFHWHYGRGVDLPSNRNEYQEYYWWGKSGQCLGLTTLPPSCADCF